MHMKFKSNFVAVLFALISVSAFCQDGVLDLSFNTPIYPNPPAHNGIYSGGTIYSTKVLSDGKLLVYGAVADYMNVVVNKVFRLFPNGVLDTSFNVGIGPNSVVFSNVPGPDMICQQADGKLLIVGAFTSFNGVARNRIVRLNYDGSIDTAFNIGTGFNSQVTSVKIQSDGKIMCGGYFSSYNGSMCNNLVRLNQDGTRDTSFNIGAGFAITSGSSYVSAFEFINNKIVVGGYFDKYNNNVKKGIVQLNNDGSLDTAVFNGAGTIANERVRQIHYHPATNKIYIAGYITSFNGVAKKNLIRLNADGTIDPTFNLNIDFTTSSSQGIFEFGFFNDGKVLICGDFNINSNTNDLALFDTNGDLVSNFNFDNSEGANTLKIYSILINNNNEIYAAGNFQHVNIVLTNQKGGIVKLHPNGDTDLSFNPVLGSNGATISSSFQLIDGKLLFCLSDQYNERPLYNSHMIKVNSDDGSIYLNEYNNYKSLPNYIATYGSNNISGEISYDNSGKIIVSGILPYKMNPNGTVDATFNDPVSYMVHVNVLTRSHAVQSDGKIVFGGNFRLNTGPNLNYRQRIARMNSNGTLDTSFNVGKGFNGESSAGTEGYYVNSLQIQTDGKIIVGGNFTTFDNAVANNIVRLNSNGSQDITFLTGVGFNNTVRHVVLQTNGKMVVGGYFTTYNGTNAAYIVRLNNNGTIDPTFSSPFILSDAYTRVNRIA